MSFGIIILASLATGALGIAVGGVAEPMIIGIFWFGDFAVMIYFKDYVFCLVLLLLFLKMLFLVFRFVEPNILSKVNGGLLRTRRGGINHCLFYWTCIQSSAAILSVLKARINQALPATGW